MTHQSNCVIYKKSIMNYQETINKIKQLFEAAAPEVGVAPVSPDVTTLTDYILQDGTKISVDKLEVGGMVTINGTPAPDGEHQLQDGTIIQTQSGSIVEISTPAEEAIDESVTSDMASEKMAAIDKTVAENCAKIKMIEESMAKQGEAIKSMMALVEKMATAPISEPAATVKNQYTAQTPMTKDEKFDAMVRAISQLKK
jgi:hypothetical protein